MYLKQVSTRISFYERTPRGFLFSHLLALSIKKAAGGILTSQRPGPLFFLSPGLGYAPKPPLLSDWNVLRCYFRPILGKPNTSFPGLNAIANSEPVTFPSFKVKNLDQKSTVARLDELELSHTSLLF
jgi:hypothetical protein